MDVRSNRTISAGIVKHPATGVITFVDDDGALDEAPTTLGAEKQFEATEFGSVPIESVSTFASGEVEVAEEVQTKATETFEVVGELASDAEEIGACGCTEELTEVFATYVWSGQAGAIVTDIGDSFGFFGDSDPMGGVLIDPIPGSDLETFPGPLAGGISIDRDGAASGELLIDPIPGDTDLPATSQATTASTDLTIVPAAYAMSTLATPMMMLSPGGAGEGGGDGAESSEDQRRKWEEWLNEKGVKRFTYFIVTVGKGEAAYQIYVTRDPRDTNRFVRIKNPNRFIEVDGIKTDVIDITNPAEHLDDLKLAEVEAVQDQVADIPKFWYQHLALHPGDTVLIAMLYQLFADGELAVRIQKLRDEGKTAAEIFSDPDVAWELGLVFGMNMIPGGGKAKGAAKGAGGVCAKLWRRLTNSESVQAAGRIWRKYVIKGVKHFGEEAVMAVEQYLRRKPLAPSANYTQIKDWLQNTVAPLAKAEIKPEDAGKISRRLVLGHLKEQKIYDSRKVSQSFIEKIYREVSGLCLQARRRGQLNHELIDLTAAEKKFKKAVLDALELTSLDELPLDVRPYFGDSLWSKIKAKALKAP